MPPPLRKFVFSPVSPPCAFIYDKLAGTNPGRTVIIEKGSRNAPAASKYRNIQYKGYFTDFPSEFTRKTRMSQRRKIFDEKTPYDKELPTFKKIGGNIMLDGIRNRQLVRISRIHENPAHLK